MKALLRFAPTFLLIALSATQALSAGQFLPVVNPNFANIPIECSTGYAYQGLKGATCTSQYFPAQAFNGAPGMSWVLTPNWAAQHEVPGSAGVTGPNTAFNPPSFIGLPFSRAAFIQGPNSEVAQTIFGFAAGQPYLLAFSLGSRYVHGPGDGNQTVEVYIDNRSIATFSLVSNTPFTTQTVFFEVATNGPHILRFVGVASGDHTAFLSGVSIRTVDGFDKD